jgi:hypothetical protein
MRSQARLSHPVQKGVTVDYAEAREILNRHRPRPWFWWALGKLAYCIACNGRWCCADVREARAYIDRLDPPTLPEGCE